MEERLLGGEEVAEILQVSRDFAYLMMKRGDIPAIQIGNVVRVRAVALQQYIHDRDSQNESAGGPSKRTS